jgi:hypothetical protein
MKSIILAALMTFAVAAIQLAQAVPTTGMPRAAEHSQPADFGPGGSETEGGWG